MKQRPIQEGDIYALGKHRLMCGSALMSTHRVALLSSGSKPVAIDLILSDPPYCSGTTVEAKKVGSSSIGTSSREADGSKIRIAGDNLSTLGYMGLLTQAISPVGAPESYIFTDWRMWPWSLQALEGCGLSSRSLIVWNKGTTGMGVRWRNQHELILWSRRDTIKNMTGKCYGNVITFPRTKNDYHPTQKPVELLALLLEAAREARTVYDPFAGSGSTLLACEKEGRVGFGMERDPRFVHNALMRWEKETGTAPKLIA